MSDESYDDSDDSNVPIEELMVNFFELIECLRDSEICQISLSNLTMNENEYLDCNFRYLVRKFAFEISLNFDF